MDEPAAHKDCNKHSPYAVMVDHHMEKKSPGLSSSALHIGPIKSNGIDLEQSNTCPALKILEKACEEHWHTLPDLRRPGTMTNKDMAKPSHKFHENTTQEEEHIIRKYNNLLSPAVIEGKVENLGSVINALIMAKGTPAMAEGRFTVIMWPNERQTEVIKFEFNKAHGKSSAKINTAESDKSSAEGRKHQKSMVTARRRARNTKGSENTQPSAAEAPTMRTAVDATIEMGDYGLCNFAPNGSIHFTGLAPKKADKEANEQLPEVGSILPVLVNKKEKKLLLRRQLGSGGYGIVHLGELDGGAVAVKTEKYSKSMLHIEMNVLRSANAANCKHFCDLIAYGSVKPEFCYMVMTLLHEDLHKLRDKLPERKFSFSTAVRLGSQSLKATQELHKIGFISRDIKPGNFAPGNKENRKIINMYDFGLARKYVDKNGNIIPSRKEVGWFGTTRYGSLSAHQGMDLGRRDDVESWFYMLVEMTIGTLPWSIVTDRAAVQTNKVACRTTGRVQLLLEAPKQYDVMMTYIDAITFDAAPDYEKIFGWLDEACQGKAKHEHWVWEDETKPAKKKETAKDKQ